MTADPQPSGWRLALGLACLVAGPIAGCMVFLALWVMT